MITSYLWSIGVQTDDRFFVSLLHKTNRFYFAVSLHWTDHWSPVRTPVTHSAAPRVPPFLFFLFFFFTEQTHCNRESICYVEILYLRTEQLATRRSVVSNTKWIFNRVNSVLTIYVSCRKVLWWKNDLQLRELGRKRLVYGYKGMESLYGREL